MFGWKILRNTYILLAPTKIVFVYEESIHIEVKKIWTKIYIIGCIQRHIQSLGKN